MKVKNPKTIAGAVKPDLTLIPLAPLPYIALGMLEGACKYGPANWRNREAKIPKRTYVRAAIGHLLSDLDGEDVDPDSASGALHIDKAICSLLVVRDAELNGLLEDDRLHKGNYAETARKVEAYIKSSPKIMEMLNKEDKI